MNCDHCGADTSNGLALCELCQRWVRSACEYLPIYFRNLARWRPGRTGSRPVPGSRVLYSGPPEAGTGDRISDTLDAVALSLLGTAEQLADDRGPFPQPYTLADALLMDDLADEESDRLRDDQAAAVALLCVAFDNHLTSIATLGWCGDFVRELGEHEEVLRGLTEDAVPGWYAGACSTCNAPTHVVPGLTWVTCKGCGTTTYARDHLDTIIEEASDWIARPARLADAVVALIDAAESSSRIHDRIRQWSRRGRIDAHRRHDDDGDEVGPKRYRLGDVLALLYGDTTKGGATTAEAS